MSLLPFWALNVSVALLSMEGQKALGFHLKYLNLCTEDERRSYKFGKIWGWVINDRIFILKCNMHMILSLQLWERKDREASGWELVSVLDQDGILLGLFISVHVDPGGPHALPKEIPSLETFHTWCSITTVQLKLLFVWERVFIGVFCLFVCFK